MKNNEKNYSITNGRANNSVLTNICLDSKKANILQFKKIVNQNKKVKKKRDEKIQVKS